MFAEMKLQKIREGFKLQPERQILFSLGLLFSNGMANYMLKVLVTFLTDIWKLDLRHAVKIINILGGASAISAILVVSLADFLGHYWMVIMTSILYCIGLGLLSRSVPLFFFGTGGTQTCLSGAKICAENLKSSTFYWALPFIGFAKAGHFVSVQALTFDKLKCIKIPTVQGPRRWRRFGPLRYKERLISARQRHKIWLNNSCGIFLGAGAFAASAGFSTFHKDWHSRFEVSACVIAGGMLVFLSGYSFHPPAWVRQSPLATVFKGFYATIVESIFTNRHPRNYPGAGHIEIVNLNTHLLHEDGAISGQDQNQGFCYVFHGWIPCTEEQKNELKRLRCLIPISLTFIMYGLIKSNSDTFFIEQGKTVKRDFRINFHNIHIANKIPIQLLSSISDVTKFAMKPLYKIIFEKRITRNNGRYSHAMKIGLGLVAGLFSCFAASLAEAKRINSLEDHGLLNNPDGIAPISMFWLTPQFVLIGMMDGLAYDGMRDFFEHNVHSSMTRYGAVLRDVVTGLGKMFSSVFVSVLDTVVIKVNGEEASWFADTVNGGHLDYYFRAVVAASLLNLLAFAYAATDYQYPEVKATDEEEDTLEKFANTVEIV